MSKNVNNEVSKDSPIELASKRKEKKSDIGAGGIFLRHRERGSGEKIGRGRSGGVITCGGAGGRMNPNQ